MFWNKHSVDFLAIGDITTDAFIKVKEASVHCDVNRENCQICMKFADKIPYESVEVVRAVGNSANASVSASRLGLQSALVANVGEDQNGKECIDELLKNRVGTHFIKSHRGKETNYHYVLWYEDERTILVKHQEYNYALPQNIGTPKWAYLSSLAENSLEYHYAITEWLKKNPSIKLAFQPGTFQMKLGKEKLAELYKKTEIFFCNVDEAKRILHIEGDVQTLLKEMRAIGPKIVVITDGPKGAYAYDGNESWFMPPYPDPKPPYERTGAGDAFASTFTIAIAKGLSVREALRWAPINSMSVVQHVGAQKGLLTLPQLEKFLQNAPTDYIPKKI